MTELKPCPMCGQSLQPFWGRNDERKLNVAGHVHPDDGPVVCALDGFVVYPQNYDKWNRRPLPAAGADPEVVERARQGLHLAEEATAAAFSTNSLECIKTELLAYHQFAAKHFPALARALLANATDEMPPARRAEGEQPSTSYVRTEK